MKVFSKEWVDQLADTLRRDAVYQDKAKAFDSSFQFIVEPAPENGVHEKLACGLNLPQCDETWEGIRPKTSFTMNGSYETLAKMIKGEVGAVRAITSRKVKVSGNLALLLKYTGAINRFMEVLGQVEGEFEGDFGGDARP